MKTRNNNNRNKESKMKTAFLKGGAIIISFILISFTVSAQDFWKQLLIESSLSNVAMIMVGNTGKIAPATVSAPSSKINFAEDKTFNHKIECESDKPLNLESWMTKYFEESVYSVNEETDANLELEDWMINNKYFRTEPRINTEKDSELKLENWMVSDNFWRM